MSLVKSLDENIEKDLCLSSLSSSRRCELLGRFFLENKKIITPSRNNTAKAIAAIVNPMVTEDFPPPPLLLLPDPLLWFTPGGEGGDGPDDQLFPPYLHIHCQQVRNKL